MITFGTVFSYIITDDDCRYRYIFSIMATFFVRISDNAGISTDSVQKALNMGNWGSIVLTAIASCDWFITFFLKP